MNNQFYKSTGISLVSGFFLMILTMLLHPAGGDIQHLINISGVLMFSHALAICCLPFVCFGFYGITHKLMTPGKWSVLAFIMLSLGLVAAMFAALVNGLTLPYFLGQYADSIPENQRILSGLLNFAFALNKPLDYIFIIATCLAIFVYSVMILKTRTFSKWIGYFGVLLMVLIVVGALTGYGFTNLAEFRIVVFSIATWKLLAGVSLIRA